MVSTVRPRAFIMSLCLTVIRPALSPKAPFSGRGATRCQRSTTFKAVMCTRWSFPQWTRQGLACWHAACCMTAGRCCWVVHRAVASLCSCPSCCPRRPTGGLCQQPLEVGLLACWVVCYCTGNGSHADGYSCTRLISGRCGCRKRLVYPVFSVVRWAIRYGNRNCIASLTKAISV